MTGQTISHYRVVKRLGGGDLRIRSRFPNSYSAMILVLVVASARRPLNAQDRPAFDPNAAFLISIAEGTVDNESVTTHSDCILVLPDGRFHLERRKQVEASPTTTLDIYESALDSTHIQRLRGILRITSAKESLGYPLPIFPMSASWFSTFNAKIPKNGQVHTVGYWKWRGGTAETSPNSTPENIKKKWGELEIGLRPLAEWFHEIVALEKFPTNSDSTLCSPNQVIESQ
jgi:hypothetical protein